MKRKQILIGLCILLLVSITTVSVSLAQSTPSPPTFIPTPFSNSSEPSVPPVPSTAPNGIPPRGNKEPELSCDASNPYPERTEIKDNKKIARLTNQLKKLKGTWQFTNTAYSSPCFEGPYKLETRTDSVVNGNAEPFTVTFQGNGFCTNYFEDPISGGPSCEKPTSFFTNGTFGDLRGGQAFIKLNKSKPEFYGIGMGGYEKFILKKVSKARK